MTFEYGCLELFYFSRVRTIYFDTVAAIDFKEYLKEFLIFSLELVYAFNTSHRHKSVHVTRWDYFYHLKRSLI